MSGHRYNRLPYFVTRSRRIVLRCLWHEEKTASLWIWPDGGYLCFGCQRRGWAREEPILAKVFSEVHPPPTVPDAQTKLDLSR